MREAERRHRQEASEHGFLWFPLPVRWPPGLGQVNPADRNSIVFSPLGLLRVRNAVAEALTGTLVGDAASQAAAYPDAVRARA